VVRSALAALEEQGLVARSTTVHGDFVASPPTLALGSAVVRRRDDIRRAELELERLAEQYRRTMADRAESDVIDVVHGPQAVAQRFAQLQRGARREVLALVRSSVAVVPADDNHEEEQAVARGVDYRVVLERSAFDRPGFLDAVTASIDAGERVRIVEELPLRLVVADRALALLPLAPTSRDSGGGALLVHPSGLLDALVHLFDLVWAAAYDVVPGTGAAAEAAGVADEDARLLTLLAAGVTDRAIGGQLGMSQRTVQRRISALMERAAVTSRFQLGLEAGRRGWVG
jgi:sugar-specific transcriptional regulator TrmB/DNA-binding CsgD family transcriptional regulator